MAKKILIVDDDLYVRDLYREICAGAGFDCQTAVDGEEGLDKIRETAFDLILLDIMMPRLDGLGFMMKMEEAAPKSKNIPVVILTNLAHESVVKQALERGAVSCLIKSDLTPDKLIQTINSFIKS